MHPAIYSKWKNENQNSEYSIITEDEIKNLKEGDTIVLPKILYCKVKEWHIQYSTPALFFQISV